MKKLYLIPINIILIAVVICLGTMVAFDFYKLKPEIVFAEDEEDEEAPAISNIKIIEVATTSAKISWETDEDSDSLVNYGIDKKYGIERIPEYDKTYHEIELSDLLPGFTYFFRITSSDESGNQGISNDYIFTTKKEEEEELTPESGEEEVVPEIIIREEVLVEEINEMIEQLTTEESLMEVQETLSGVADEVATPPTISIDLADVEVGEDYAVLTWRTDKEANTVVALANELEYNPDADDPYAWREGNPNEMVVEHEVRINGLQPATTYHYQVSSESALGLIGVSNDGTFTTKSVLPEIYNIRVSKVEEESATLSWATNVPCSVIVEYTNLMNNVTKLEGSSNFVTYHVMKLSNLEFDTTYMALITVESELEERTTSDPVTFTTKIDEFPPTISKVSTESTLYPGADNKIQTIVSWNTDELSSCQLFFQQGLLSNDEDESLQKEEDMLLKHVQVVTSFLPGTVYKFWVVCSDEVGNEGRSEDFTMLTPSQEESIIDIIIKNFESTFGWVKKFKF